MALEHALTRLNRDGMNLVQRPDVRLQPLDVLGRDDVLEQIGTLASLFTSPAPVPVPADAVPGSTFNGEETELIHVSIGSKLLKRYLNGLGSSVEQIELKAQAGEIRFVRFVFEDALTVSVASQDIAKYLFTAQPHPGPLRDRYLVNPEADAYVVTQVLQSRVLRMVPTDLGGEIVAVDVPALVERVGAAVRVTSTSRDIKFAGETPMTLAFSCRRLEFAGGTWGLAGNAGGPLLIAPGMRVLVTPARTGALAS